MSAPFVPDMPTTGSPDAKSEQQQQQQPQQQPPAVRRGYLHVRSLTNANAYTRRWCVLNGQFIFLAKSERDSMRHPVGVIDLAECTVTSVDAGGDGVGGGGDGAGSSSASITASTAHPFAFAITHSHRPTQVLSTGSAATLATWLAAVDAAIHPVVERTAVLEYRGQPVFDSEDADEITRAKLEVTQFVTVRLERAAAELASITAQTKKSISQVLVMKQQRKLVAAEIKSLRHKQTQDEATLAQLQEQLHACQRQSKQENDDLASLVADVNNILAQLDTMRPHAIYLATEHAAKLREATTAKAAEAMAANSAVSMAAAPVASEAQAGSAADDAVATTPSLTSQSSLSQSSSTPPSHDASRLGLINATSSLSSRSAAGVAGVVARSLVARKTSTVSIDSNDTLPGDTDDEDDDDDNDDVGSGGSSSSCGRRGSGNAGRGRGGLLDDAVFLPNTGGGNGSGGRGVDGDGGSGGGGAVGDGGHTGDQGSGGDGSVGDGSGGSNNSSSGGTISQDRALSLSHQYLTQLLAQLPPLIHTHARTDAELRDLLLHLLATNGNLRKMCNQYSEHIHTLTQDKLRRFDDAFEFGVGVQLQGSGSGSGSGGGGGGGSGGGGSGNSSHHDDNDVDGSGSLTVDATGRALHASRLYSSVG